jgi:glycosyltransferase involved in cell wall biosynthesis
MKKIAYLVSHPIQYQAPMLKYIAKNINADLEVLFLSDMSVKGYTDREFNQRVLWDTPLLEGYNFKFLKTFGYKNKTTFFSPVCLNIFSVMKNGNYDYIWLHGWGSINNILAIFFAKKLKIKVLLRGESGIHMPQGSPLKAYFKKIVLNYLFKKVHYFLAIGSMNANFYKFYGVESSKILVMPYAVDNVFFQEKSKFYKGQTEYIKKILNIECNAKIILYASKLTRRKNSLDLLMAYSKLIKNISQNQPYLLIVGSGELEKELKHYVKKLALNRVKFLGFVNQSELPKYYELCDVFVLPSSEEQWGLVINEVMNHSKPVIISDEVGCGPDLVEDKVNGYIFKCGDIDHLELCLRKTLYDNKNDIKSSSANLSKINSWSFYEDTQALKIAIGDFL